MVFLALCFLSACATTGTDVVIGRSETTVVEVPISGPCPDPAKIPARPAPSAPKGDVHNKAAAATADLLAMDIYSRQLESLLHECSK